MLNYKRMNGYLNECEHRTIPNPKSNMGTCKAIGDQIGATWSVGPKVCANCFMAGGGKPSEGVIGAKVATGLLSMVEGANLGFYNESETEEIYRKIVDYTKFMAESQKRAFLSHTLRGVHTRRISPEFANWVAEKSGLREVANAQSMGRSTGGSGTIPRRKQAAASAPSTPDSESDSSDPAETGE